MILNVYKLFLNIICFFVWCIIFYWYIVFEIRLFFGVVFFNLVVINEKKFFKFYVNSYNVKMEVG